MLQDRECVDRLCEYKYGRLTGPVPRSWGVPFERTRDAPAGFLF